MLLSMVGAEQKGQVCGLGFRPPLAEGVVTSLVENGGLRRWWRVSAFQLFLQGAEQVPKRSDDCDGMNGIHACL